MAWRLFFAILHALLDVVTRPHWAVDPGANACVTEAGARRR